MSIENYSLFCLQVIADSQGRLSKTILFFFVGRTFPSHPYFKSQLGAGQLSLFNILKAYSLVDTEVGYCQGLAFVAGILLMHVRYKPATLK